VRLFLCAFAFAGCTSSATYLIDRDALAEARRSNAEGVAARRASDGEPVRVRLDALAPSGKEVDKNLLLVDAHAISGLGYGGAVTAAIGAVLTIAGLALISQGHSYETSCHASGDWLCIDVDTPIGIGFAVGGAVNLLVGGTLAIVGATWRPYEAALRPPPPPPPPDEPDPEPSPPSRAPTHAILPTLSF